MQIYLLEICLWRRHIFHVTIRYQFGENAQRLTGSRMMFQYQTRCAQLQNDALFVGEQCITGDRAIGEC